MATRNLRHGAAAGAKTAEYRIWTEMRERCRNKSNRRYGGRGILVCDRWEQSFEAFLADMGQRPSPGHSLDRINNDGDYEPGNVRWATAEEQGRNRSTTVRLTVGGETKTIDEWAAETGICPDTLRIRIRAGWSPEDVIRRPLRKVRRSEPRINDGRIEVRG